MGRQSRPPDVDERAVTRPAAGRRNHPSRSARCTRFTGGMKTILEPSRVEQILRQRPQTRRTFSRGLKTAGLLCPADRGSHDFEAAGGSHRPEPGRTDDMTSRSHRTPIAVAPTILGDRRVVQIYLRGPPDQDRNMTNADQRGRLALHDWFCVSNISAAISYQKRRGIVSS